MYADPQNPDVVYLMGTAIYRSTDGGQHVAAFWGAPSGADPRFLWIDPTNSKRMIAGVDQGAAISVDGGESWTPYYGLSNGQFYRVSTDYDFPVSRVRSAAGFRHRVRREPQRLRRDPAERLVSGRRIRERISDRRSARQALHVHAGLVSRAAPLRSHTGQVVVLYQPTADDRFGGAPPLAFSPQDPHTLYMAAQYVLASTDRGQTWRTISPDLAGAAGRSAADAARGRRAGGVGAPGAGRIDPVARAVAGHRRRDLGRHEHRADPRHARRRQDVDERDAAEPAAGGINVIDASHANAGTAYAALLSRDAHPHIYRTSDYGKSWQEISSGLADGEVVRVVREDPVDPNLLYAGTVTSAYVSFDRGDHWQSLQLNLPATVVSDMTVHEQRPRRSRPTAAASGFSTTCRRCGRSARRWRRTRRRFSSSRRRRRARDGTTRRTRRCRRR